MEDDGAEAAHEQNHKAIISALAWVDRGHASAVLKEYDPTEEEMNKHKKRAQKILKGQDLHTDLAQINSKNEEMEEESDEDDNMPIFTSELAALKEKELGKPKEENNSDLDDDIDMTPAAKDNYPDEFSDSEDEKDDYTIRKTDSLIVAATAEDDFSNLEVYVYDH